MAMRPYDSQYEDSYDPWPQGRRDRLVWLLFFAPGSMFLWLEYMFPKRGQVWASRRRAENKVVQVIYSLGFWLMIPILLIRFFPLPPVGTGVNDLRFDKAVHSADAKNPYNTGYQQEQARQHYESQMRVSDERKELGDFLVGSYNRCLQQSGLVLPLGFTTSVTVFFDAAGDVTGVPMLKDRPANARVRLVAYDLLSVMRSCDVEVPGRLKYLSSTWKSRSFRFEPRPDP